MSASSTRSRPAVIVDPYSSGSGLASAFRERGVACVAVRTAPEAPAPLRSTWRPQDFDAVYVFDGDLARLAAAVAAHDPRCIVAGAEPGVELADALVDAVLPATGNSPGMSAARRDKYLMALALQAAGMSCLRQVCTDRHADVEAWISENGLGGRRLVVKPPKSGGTEDVYVVEAGGDWRVHFDHILGRTNVLGLCNDAVLVQEFAAGTEYIVDTYSVDGRHGLVDVCRYAKASRGERIGIYDRVDFVAPEDTAVAPLVAYTQRVLDALGIRNGAAHAEVMMTADGPFLIEVGARPAGAAHQELARLATGDSQIERCAAHWVGEVFRSGYELRRGVRAVFLSSPRAGVLRNVEVLDAIDELPAFHSKTVLFANGDVVPATVDLATPLGLVVLVSEDDSRLRADYEAIKDLEAQLQVETPVPAEV